MLRYQLIHPDILQALGTAGHGSKVLLADGNYPFTTGSNPQAKRVYLNVAPGLVTVPQVLGALVSAIPLERAEVMQTADGSEPPIWNEFRGLLGPDLPLVPLERFAFYDAGRHPDVALVIATGEQRVYANLLLTIGVVASPS